MNRDTLKQIMVDQKDIYLNLTKFPLYFIRKRNTLNV